MRIRVGTDRDMMDISELSGEVFAPYGDYRQVLPDYLLNANVVTFVGEVDGGFAGFIQIALEPGGPNEFNPVWADIVAVAIRPRLQGRGLGTMLFRHAFSALDRWRSEQRAFEVWLTVAHTNERAIQLFDRLGFEMTGIEAGDYVGGQRAMRMCKVLDPPEKKGA